MSGPDLPLSRRTVLLGVSAAAGLALSGGAARWLRGPAEGLHARACLEQLYASLNDGQRELMCLPWDHPARQITNTSPILQRPHLGSYLRAEQRELVLALTRTMLSREGLVRFAPTFAVEAGGLDGCTLILYGRPDEPGFQASLNGGHLHLRTSESRASGAAFGGAIAYGQQKGNGRFKVEGNSFAFQSDFANAVYAALPSAQRAAARLAQPIAERVVQVQGATGRFPGLGVNAMGDAARSAMKSLLEGVFRVYPPSARAEAWSSIERNGGLDALHLAFFEEQGFYADGTTFAELDAAERAKRPDPYFQVWRVEGPSTVIHFQGHPHVHAYVNVVGDPTRQNVGEALARLDAPLEGDGVRAFVERALARATGAEAGFAGAHPQGRLCPGEVTTGALWSLDPYVNRVVVATIRGDALAPELRASLAAQGIVAKPGTTHRIATSEYFANDPRDFGHVERIEETGVGLRELLVAHVRRHGIGAS